MLTCDKWRIELIEPVLEENNVDERPDSEWYEGHAQQLKERLRRTWQTGALVSLAPRGKSDPVFQNSSIPAGSVAACLQAQNRSQHQPVVSRRT